MFGKIKEEKDNIDAEKLVCVKSDGTTCNFNIFKNSLEFAANIYNVKISLKEAKNKQYEMLLLLEKLKNYNPINSKKIKSKKETVKAAESLYENRNSVIKACKSSIFPFEHGFQKEKSDKESDEESDEESDKKTTKSRWEEFINGIEKESKGQNYELFKNNFSASTPGVPVN